MRNEAHRFGISHHRNRRLKGLIKTDLSSIDGIGEKTITQLLKKYKSINVIKEISLKELEDFIGLSKAQKVYQSFKNKQLFYFKLFLASWYNIYYFWSIHYVRG